MNCKPNGEGTTDGGVTNVTMPTESATDDSGTNNQNVSGDVLLSITADDTKESIKTNDQNGILITNF